MLRHTHTGLHECAMAPKTHHTVQSLAAWSRLRAMLLPLLLLAATAAAGPTGCGGDEIPPGPPPPLTLTLGTIDQAVAQSTGDIVWADLTPGQQVQLAPGAQGGFHVWLLYRVAGNDQTRTVGVQRLADRIGDGESRLRVLTTDGIVDLTPEPLWQLKMPVPSFMCPTPIGVNVLDAPVEIVVRMHEGLGNEILLAEQSIRLLVSCPPVGDPQHDFCLRICQGKP
jgi:hypothetical protein